MLVLPLQIVQEFWEFLLRCLDYKAYKIYLIWFY